MHDSDAFRTSGSHVISENIDGEVVLVNLDKGIYYSTDQVGADLWELIEAGRSVRGMCEALGARYDAPPDEIAAAVSKFLAELVQEELIVIDQPERDGQPLPSQATGAKLAFRPPRLNKYSDMRDMLLLDPIHDVEESGWPTPKTMAS